MKSSMDIRLECLRLATVLGSGKNIKPSEVVPYAMEFFRWVEGREEHGRRIEQATKQPDLFIEAPKVATHKSPSPISGKNLSTKTQPNDRNNEN